MKTKPGISKYFIAIVPPQPVYDEALKWKELFRDRFHTKAALRSPPHITLHMPFEWKSSKQDLLIEGLTRFASSCKRFEVQLSGFGSFPPRVIFINVMANPLLQEMQALLFQFCKSNLNLFNADRKDHPYNPHLTIAFRDLKKSIFSQAWAVVQHEKFEYPFLCNNLTLLQHNGKSWDIMRQFDFNPQSFV